MNNISRWLGSSISFIRIPEPYSRYLVYLLVGVLVSASVFGQYKIFNNIVETKDKSEQESIVSSLKSNVLGKLSEIQKSIQEAKKIGADTKELEKSFNALKESFFIESPDLLATYKTANEILATSNKLINNQKALNEAAEKIGTLTGDVAVEDKMLAGALISVKDNETSATTDSNGEFSLELPAGEYVVTASRSGYNSQSKSITIKAKDTITASFVLTVYVPPPPVSNKETNGDSSYEFKSVKTSIGTFSAHVSTFNLASGQFKVITDTANNSDCTDNCPTKSLGSYVSTHGAFAGMNGTYFCPADYGSCAGKVGTFVWRVLNYRNGTMINESLGDNKNDPFIAFDSSGTARYFSAWSSYGSSGFNAVSGISCEPPLISGGSNILNPGWLDDKQRYTKSNRGAIGLKGQVLYLVVAKSATVVDSAAIMDALGVDYALNLDGGGSSAMMFNNSYKAGPGRSIPNAIVIARR